jgi:hypothetical protein
VETSADIGPQGILHVLVGERKVKPIRVEVAATPLFHRGVLQIVPVGHDIPGRPSKYMASDLTFHAAVI